VQSKDQFHKLGITFLIQKLFLALSRKTGNHKIPNLCGQLHKFDATSCKDDQVYKSTYMSMVIKRHEGNKHLLRSTDLHTDQMLNV